LATLNHSGFNHQLPTNIQTPRDIKNNLTAGEELTFVYPSTEREMAQRFYYFCAAGSCQGYITNCSGFMFLAADTCGGYISGAKNMKPEQLKGIWLNAHIRALQRVDILLPIDRMGHGTRLLILLRRRKLPRT
jgi:hypothetical protein